MKAEFFKAVCPLEIGDTVAIWENKQKIGEPITAYYLPENASIIVSGSDIADIAKVTDIATMHYLKSGETLFLYELNGNGAYKPMTVKMPADIFDKELKKQGRNTQKAALFLKS